MQTYCERSSRDPFLVLGTMKKSAKYKKDGLGHQNRENVNTTGLFKIMIEF